MKKIKCIVIRKQRFRETSALIKVLTPEGIMDFAVRGFYRKKSMFNSHLEPFSINEIEFRKRNRDGLQTLHSAVLQYYPEHLLKKTSSIETAYAILKIIRNIHNTDTSERIFEFTVAAVRALNEDADAKKTYAKFLIRFMLAEGIINLDSGENIQLKKGIIDLFKDKNEHSSEALIINLERNLQMYG